MKKMWVIALFALQACSEVGLFPTSGSDGGSTATIPRVKINCTSSQCMANASGPLINVVITTSSCSDPLFGAVVSTSTRAISCSSLIGCNGEVSGWVSSSGPASTIVSGSYQICGCIHFSGSGTPWVNCDSVGTLNSVTISDSTSMQFISSWDH